MDPLPLSASLSRGVSYNFTHLGPGKPMFSGAGKNESTHSCCELAEQAVSQKETSHSSDNLSDCLVGETAVRQ